MCVVFFVALVFFCDVLFVGFVWVFFGWSLVGFAFFSFLLSVYKSALFILTCILSFTAWKPVYDPTGIVSLNKEIKFPNYRN